MARSTKRNDLLVDVRMPHRRELMAALADLNIPEAKAKKLLEFYPDGRGLSTATRPGLLQAGLTEAQARRVLAAFKVAQVCDMACEARVERWNRATSPTELVGIIRRAIGRQEQEFFAVILLDSRQRVLDIVGVSVGSLAQVDVHPREAFREAVRRGAHSIILAHNHPSGDAEPSEADIELTLRMGEVGRTVGIPVLDHLIMTPRQATSLAARGLVSNPARDSADKRRLMR